MKVFVNNEQTEIQNQTTVKKLLDDLNLQSSKGIAVAINQEVIPKVQWENLIMKENDKVMIIKATQGG